MKLKQLKPKLKPLHCPFCGKMPKIGPSKPEEEGNAWGFVACSNKRCAVSPSVTDGCVMADERGTGAYIDLAIKRWNKRKG